MGYNPYAIPLIKLSHERKIGNMKLDEIELSGDPLENVSMRFEVNAKDRIKNKFMDYYFRLFNKCALSIGKLRGIYKR